MLKPKAKCNYCGQTYACDRNTGTSTLRTHLMHQCKKCPAYVHNKKQKHISFDSRGTLEVKAYNFEVAKLALIKMIVKDELPFSFVDGEGFQEYTHALQPQFSIPSRIKITRDIWDLFLCEKEKIKNYFAAENIRLSLTTDTWTYVQNINYLVLTGHFIDGAWTLQKGILNFCVILDHKGKTIGTLVERCLYDWGIERVYAVVVDNASSNQVALEHIRERIGSWGSLVLGGTFLHVRCCCHLLNLIVRDGMAELDDSIEAIRNDVKYIRSSPSRLEKFRVAAQMAKVEHKGGVVPMDVCIRWNSTYFMLDIAVKYNKAFSKLEDEDQLYYAYFQDKIGGKKRNGPPKKEDWSKAATLVRFLKIFYDATLSFSGTKVVSSNQSIQWICAIVDELENCLSSEDPMMVRVGLAMREKFDKYWNEDINVALAFAVVLDPRYKLLYLKFFFPKLYKKNDTNNLTMEEEKSMKKAWVKTRVDAVISKFRDLYLEYAAKVGVPSQTSINMENDEASLFDGEEHDSHNSSMSQFMKLRKQKDVVEIKDEIDKYFNELSQDPSTRISIFWIGGRKMH